MRFGHTNPNPTRRYNLTVGALFVGLMSLTFGLDWLAQRKEKQRRAMFQPVQASTPRASADTSSPKSAEGVSADAASFAEWHREYFAGKLRAPFMALTPGEAVNDPLNNHLTEHGISQAKRATIAIGDELAQEFSEGRVRLVVVSQGASRDTAAYETAKVITDTMWLEAPVEILYRDFDRLLALQDEQPDVVWVVVTEPQCLSMVTSKRSQQCTPIYIAPASLNGEALN